MQTVSGRAGIAPSCILRVQGRAHFARPAGGRYRHLTRVGAGDLQLLEKTESADGATVFTFGSAAEAPAAKKQPSPPKASASQPAAPSGSGAQNESAKPASSAPPASEKKIRPPPKDGNYSGYEMEELREYAKQRGILGYQKLRRQPLIDTLKRNDRWKVNH